MPAKKKPADEGHFTLGANGHVITGVKRRGRWAFVCDSWPDIAKKHEGAASLQGVTDDFMARALAAILDVVRQAAEGA